jgi:hypothetical protein
VQGKTQEMNHGQTPANHGQTQDGPLAQSVRIAVIAALVSVALNTLAPFAREPRGVLPKALALVPAAAVTAVLWLKPTTAMMVWAFSQRWYTDR